MSVHLDVFLQRNYMLYVIAALSKLICGQCECVAPVLLPNFILFRARFKAFRSCCAVFAWFCSTLVSVSDAFHWSTLKMVVVVSGSTSICLVVFNVTAWFERVDTSVLQGLGMRHGRILSCCRFASLNSFRLKICAVEQSRWS